MKATILLGAFLSAMTASAVAQDKGQFGLDFTFDPSSEATTTTLGPRYSLTSHVTARATLRMQNKTWTVPNTIGVNNVIVYSGRIDVDQNVFGVGFSLLWYLRRKDGFSTYVGADYQHNQSTEHYPAVFVSKYPPASSPERSETARNNAYGAFLGLQHNFSRHFAVFGEVGLRYSKGRPLIINTGPIKESAVLNTGLGAILYVN